MASLLARRFSAIWGQCYNFLLSFATTFTLKTLIMKLFFKKNAFRRKWVNMYCDGATKICSRVNGPFYDKTRETKNAYQDHGEQDDHLGDDAQEGPEGRVLVLHPHEADALGAGLHVGHVVGDALEPASVRSVAATSFYSPLLKTTQSPGSNVMILKYFRRKNWRFNSKY
jgi:hypothetical protein